MVINGFDLLGAEPLNLEEFEERLRELCAKVFMISERTGGCQFIELLLKGVTESLNIL